MHLLRVELDDGNTEALGRLDIERILALGRRTGLNLVGDVLDWLGQQASPEGAVAELRKLGPDAAQRIAVSAGLATIQAALEDWERNTENDSEEFWQRMLGRNAFVLSQAFSVPFIIIKSKPYLGGKDLSNTGGRYGDFLASNPTTKNPLLIEIKTPSTPLLRRAKYRDDLYAASEDLIGGTAQVVNYRQSFVADPRLVQGFEDQVEHFSPRCLLLIGSTDQLVTPDHKRSFELLRSSIPDVAIVTYDELFTRLRSLIEVFAI